MSTDNGPIPLDSLPVGRQATIEAVSGGHGLVNRLATLGFIPGQRVDMVQNFGVGPLIVNVQNTRIALGRGEARKILVREG